MMTAGKLNRVDHGLNVAGYGLVIGLALLVPLFDRQPVNTLAVLLAITVATRLALRGRSWLKEWDAIDWSMVALLLSAILSTLFGWPATGRFQGIAEAVSYLALFLCIRHGGHEETALRTLGVAAILGTMLAAGHALLFHAAGSPFELPGVTGTIRSSLYTGITLMLCIGLVLHAHGARRAAGMAVALFLTAMVLSMTSRGVLLTIGLCLLLGFFARYRRRAFKYFLISAIVLAIATALMPQSMVGQLRLKTTELAELVVHGKVSANDQLRIEIWRVALAWINRGEHILLGIGPRNYPLIDEDQLALSPPLQFEETRQISHAHNLFLTRYVEQGLFGLLTLLALLALLARRLLRDGMAGRTGWSWWGALGGLLLPVVSGLFNSPWSRDYAWLAVFTFALYLAPRPAAFPRP